MNRWFSWILALAVVVAANPALATDVLVWTSVGGGGYLAHWVSVEGDTVTSLATRNEAVVSDGTRIWAAKFETKPVNLYPCEAMEDESLMTAEGTFDWPFLTLVELTGNGKLPIIKEDMEGTFFGEIWTKKVSLEGSAGPHLMLNHLNNGYGCGAHGYDESGRYMFSAVAGNTVRPSTLLKNESRSRGPAVRALSKDVKAEECWDDEFSKRSIVLDGLSLFAGKSGIGMTATYVHPTGADWDFRCSIEHSEALDNDQIVPAALPTTTITKALKALKLSGTVGYATLTLTGDARAAALSAFTTKALPKAKRTRAKADAVPHINKGRKLTGKKKYVEAIAAFDTAIRKDPNAARAWSGRGYAKLLAGQLDKAARDFDHALTLDASDAYQAAIWFNFGQVAEKQKKLKQARRAYRKANALKPSKAAKAALDKVTELLKTR